MRSDDLPAATHICPQAYCAIKKGSLETAQARLSLACTAFAADKRPGEDWFDVVARTVKAGIAGADA